MAASSEGRVSPGCGLGCPGPGEACRCRTEGVLTSGPLSREVAEVVQGRQARSRAPWWPPLQEDGRTDTHSGRSTGAGGCRVGSGASSCRTVETAGLGRAAHQARLLPGGVRGLTAAKATLGSSHWVHHPRQAGKRGRGAPRAGAQPGVRAGGLVRGQAWATVRGSVATATLPRPH